MNDELYELKIKHEQLSSNVDGLMSSYNNMASTTSGLRSSCDELSTLCQQLSDRISQLESGSGSSGSGSGIDQSVIDDLNSQIATIKTQLESGEFCKLNTIVTKEEFKTLTGLDADVPEHTYQNWILALIRMVFMMTDTLTQITDKVDASLAKMSRSVDIITCTDSSQQDKLYVSHADGSLGMILALTWDEISETHKLAPILNNSYLHFNVSSSISSESDYEYQYICDTIWICCNNADRLNRMCASYYLNPNFKPEEVKRIHYVSNITEFGSEYNYSFDRIPEVFPNVEYFYFECPNITKFGFFSPACYFSKLIYHNFPANTIELFSNIFGDNSHPLLNDTFTFDYPASIRKLNYCDISYSPLKTDIIIPPNIEAVNGTEIKIPSECKTIYVDKALNNAWKSINFRVPDTDHVKSIVLAEGITKTPHGMFYSLYDAIINHPINVTLPLSLTCLDENIIEYNGAYPNSVLNYYVNGQKLMKKVEDRTVMDLGMLYNLDTLYAKSISIIYANTIPKLEVIIPNSVTKIINDGNYEYVFDIDVDELTIHIPSSITEVVPNAIKLIYRSPPTTIKYHYKTGEDYTTNVFYQWLTSLYSSTSTIELVEDN